MRFAARMFIGKPRAAPGSGSPWPTTPTVWMASGPTRRMPERSHCFASRKNLAKRAGKKKSARRGGIRTGPSQRIAGSGANGVATVAENRQNLLVQWQSGDDAGQFSLAKSD